MRRDMILNRQNPDEALISKYMPWITKMAFKHSFVSRVVDFDDLQSVGMYAVLQGRDSYKEGYGTHISSHIMTYVRMKILNEVNNNLDYKRSFKNRQIAVNKAKEACGEDATYQELSNWMKSHYKSAASKLNVQAIKNTEAQTNVSMGSLDAIKEREGVQTDRWMPSVECTAESEMEEKLKLDVLRFYFNKLNIQEQKVMARRLEGLTLEVIGQEMNLTRERIRQIEVKAKRKLSHNVQNTLAGAFKTFNPIKRVLNNNRNEVRSNSTPVQKDIIKEPIKKEVVNEPSPKISKPDISRLHGRDIRRPRSTPREKSPINARSTSVVDRPRRKTNIKTNELPNAPIEVRLGAVVCDGLYRITEVLIPGVRYEVLNVETCRYTVLKASEIF